MTISEIIAAAVGIFSILLLVVQIHAAARALKEDHLRQKQQATLDYLVHDVHPHWKEELRTFKRTFGNASPMPEEVLDRLRSDPETKFLIVKLLGNIENMAVGVNVGVYDITLLNRASGAFLIRVFKQFLPFIRQAQIKQASAYVEFEGLVLELCRLRGIAPPSPTKASDGDGRPTVGSEVQQAASPTSVDLQRRQAAFPLSDDGS